MKNLSLCLYYGLNTFPMFVYQQQNMRKYCKTFNILSLFSYITLDDSLYPIAMITIL